jgi:hypothetical protein
MPENTNLVNDVEAFLAAAKSYDEEKPDPVAQLDLLGRVKAIALSPR